MTLAALLTGTALPDDADLAALDPRHLAVVERATAREPMDRFRSASAFAAALEELRADEAATGPGGAGTAGDDERRRRLLLGAAGLALLLLVPLALWLAGRGGEDEPGGAGSPTGTGACAGEERPAGDGPARTEPEDYGLLDAVTALRERLRPHLDGFSFRPPDLSGFTLALEHGELADRVTGMVRLHGDRGLAPPPDLAAVDLLLELERALERGADPGYVLRRLDALASEHPEDATARMAGALAALADGRPERARELVAGLEGPTAKGIRAAAGDG
mgnify:CR=1 FL=1